MQFTCGRGTQIQILVSLLASVGAVASGLSISWPNIALPVYDTMLSPTKTEKFFIASVPALGVLSCSPLLLIFPERIGRKWLILTGNLIEAVSWILLYDPGSVTAVLLGRYLEGFGSNLIFGVATVFIAEMSSPKIRGSLETLFPILYNVGMSTTSILGPHISLNVISVLGVVFTMLNVLLFPFVPESPYFLLQKGKDEQAQKALAVFRGKEDNAAEMQEIKQGVIRQHSEHKHLLDMFRVESSRKGIATALLLYLFMELGGNDVFVNYSQLMFLNGHVHVSQTVTGIVYGFFKLLACFISLGLVDSVGRRTLLLVSGVGSSITLFMMALFFLLDAWEMVSSLGWVGLTILTVYLLVYNVGLGTIPYVLIAEMFPSGGKFIGIFFAQLAYSIFCFLSLALFDVTAEIGVQVHVPMWIFSGICALSVVFTLLFIKETKGKTLENIQMDLKATRIITP